MAHSDKFSLSFPFHFISSSFPLCLSKSASPPHRCASSSWVINRDGQTAVVAIFVLMHESEGREIYWWHC
ncbi:hypothetical protein V6Z11_D07G163600 [Gossypium hirsutum]